MDLLTPILSASLAAVGAWGALTQRLSVLEERTVTIVSRMDRIEAKLDISFRQ